MRLRLQDAIGLVVVIAIGVFLGLRLEAWWHQLF
jgi:hypothetical protein